MEERAVIDRIVDGRLAALLVGDAQQEWMVDLEQLPQGAREGTWLTVRFEGDRLVGAELDSEGTEAARTRIQEKMERLRKRGRRLG